MKGASGTSSCAQQKQTSESKTKHQHMGARPPKSQHGNNPALTFAASSRVEDDGGTSSTALSFSKRPAEAAPVHVREHKIVRASQQESAGADVWAERFSPAASADLAVHKDKVRELRDWMELNRRHIEQGSSAGQRVLVLRGPPGSGKTAMVKVVAAEAKMRLIEYGCGPAVTFAENKWCDTPWVSEVQELVNFLRSTQTFGRSSLMADQGAVREG
jgi:hypothetical protein